ncbi:MAG: hypothetical protein JWN15_1300 [Firmicutes bacterium]|nr:hypothetical protein [Bacillota bacterium]
MTPYQSAPKPRLLPVALFAPNAQAQAGARKRLPGTALWTAATVVKASRFRISGAHGGGKPR